MAEISPLRPLIKAVQIAVSDCRDDGIADALARVAKILRDAGIGAPDEDPAQERAAKRGRDRQERGGFDRAE